MNARRADGPAAVVMIEDDAGHADLLRMAWQEAGVPDGLTIVDTGDAALDLLGVGSTRRTPHLPRLILVDLNLPGRDGREILVAIRSDERFANVPVVIMSTSTSPEDRSTTQRAGADDYVVKPHRFAQLVTAVSDIAARWLTTETQPAHPR